MALGAVFVSLPVAFAFSLYGCMLRGMTATEGVMLYAVMGAAVVLSLTLVNAARLNDLR